MSVMVNVKIPKDLQKHLRGIGKHVVQPVLAGIAVDVQTVLSEQKPEKAPRGAMKFASRKQRAFVMAGIRDGSIKVPYRRGSDSKSERLNRSFTIAQSNKSVQLHNSASYMQYVIGNKQARIHKGRWITGINAFEKVRRSGKIEYLVKYLLGRYFIGG